MPKSKKSKLPITEDIDFEYLLGLMRPLHDVDEFAWLPELFVLIGHEKLIDLCRYCGGETIKIPTLDQLALSIDALQWFYDIYIKKCHTIDDVPDVTLPLVVKIKKVFDARNDKM